MKGRIPLATKEFNFREREFFRDEETNSLNDLLPVSPAERKEILDNAKLVAITLKTAAQDVDCELGFVSDSDAEGSHRTFAIDTATYNKHAPTEIYSKTRSV